MKNPIKTPANRPEMTAHIRLILPGNSTDIKTAAAIAVIAELIYVPRLRDERSDF